MRPIYLILLTLLFALPASADAERGTAEEAMSLVAKAIDLYQRTSADQAFLVINDPDSEFRDRDLYIFVVGPDGMVAAHGADPSRIGIDARTVHDADGKPYGQMIIDSAIAEGVWVDYKRLNPANDELEQKSSWLVRVDGYIFGCGIYKPLDG